MLRTWLGLLVIGLIILGVGFTSVIWPDWFRLSVGEKLMLRPEVSHTVSAPIELREIRPAPTAPTSLPQRADSEEQKLYDRLTGSLRSAQYAFNHPDVMYLSRRSQITLTLAADATGVLAALKQQFEGQPEGTVKAGVTKYAPMMEATLRGKDFKIDPPEAQRRTVLLSKVGPTEWTWFVEPLETGASKLLVLELFARLSRGNDNLPPLLIKTFEARINVDVRVFDRLLIEARRMTPVAQAFTGAGGLIAVIGFIGTTRRWLKGPKKKAAIAPD
jgi:hypothetical protein